MSEKEFEKIFQQHYNDLYRFIYHYIMDGDEAKDLTQDVFIAFYENYGGLPPEEDRKQVLLSIAKNRCISYFRHRDVIDRHALKCFEALVFSASSEYDTTYDDLFLQLNLTMDKLTPLQQKIIRLKLADKSYAEMAEELGATPSQIHKHIKKAYDIIRRNAKSADEDDDKIVGMILLHILSREIFTS